MIRPTISLSSNISRCRPMSPERLSHLSHSATLRAVAVSGLLFLLFYVSSFNFWHGRVSSEIRLPFALKWPGGTWLDDGADGPALATNLSHVVFGIVGSLRTWGGRKPYLESWWRPNVTRGYLFLDGVPENESLLCPSTCPPLWINEDITKWEIYPQIKHPIQIRMVWSIVEAFRQSDRDARWFVMADDDSVLFVDNIVNVLSKYDHTKYFYLGASSESVLSNVAFSFGMGFGGAGFALSYPLVAALVKRLDGCIKRYPYMWSADYLTYICIADLGVAMSPQKGFHQIDLVDDISGLLSSHTQSPVLSLHHVEIVDPIFPSMNRSGSIAHLMKPAKTDQSRLLQQAICYQKNKNWTVSVSWGYSAHIYENPIPRYILRRPIETFGPWKKKARRPKFMFNTRPVNNDSCEAPHWFFFESIERRDKFEILTTYAREGDRRLGPCSVGGNHSADYISRIRVFSLAKRRVEDGRAECCDVLPSSDKNTTTVRIRRCMEAEEIIMA